MNAIRNLSLVFLFALAFSIDGLAQNTVTHTGFFIENKGQIIDQNGFQVSEVKFHLQSQNLNVQLKNNEFSYDVFRQTNSSSLEGETPQYQFHRIDISFPGSSVDAILVPGIELRGYLNFYTQGTDAQGILNVRKYNSVTCKNLYPGIDIEYLVPENGTSPLEYNFIIHPGANPDLIQMRYSGSLKTEISGKNLMHTLAFGSLAEHIPSSYLTDGTQIEIEYTQTDEHTIAFKIPAYSKNQALVIDPVPELIWGTYIGGNSNDQGYSVAADIWKNLYVTGETSSGSAIATSGAFQTTLNGSIDAYLAKFDFSGAVQWITYFGGSGNDKGQGLTTSSDGNIYMIGETNSSSGISTNGAFQTSYGGGIMDALLVKFGPSGNRIWATYYGGSRTDFGYGVCIGKTGNLYIAGNSTSTSGIATSGTHQTSRSIGFDLFLVRFDTTGSREWGTYLGGDGVDLLHDLTLDVFGNPVITGETSSSINIASSGAFQTSNSGDYDGVVAKFTPSGSRSWSTYYGGSNYDVCYGATVDSFGNIYFTGETQSSSGISSSGAYQENHGGMMDAFLVKFDSSGSRTWGTYYGGMDEDYGYGIAIDEWQNIHFTGWSMSDADVATPGAWQDSLLGHDITVAKFSNNGSLLWGTYYGGNNQEHGYDLVYISPADVFITGRVTSTNNISTSGAYQTSHGGGGNDSYLSRFTDCTNIGSAGNITGNQTICAGSTQIYSISPVSGVTEYEWSFPQGWTGSGTSNSITVVSSANSGTITVTPKYNSCLGSSATLNVTVTGFQVNAGADQRVCSTTPASLNATVSPSGFTSLWSIISGTGNFSNASSLSTTISGLSNGITIVKLTVTDSLGACAPVSDTLTLNRLSSPSALQTLSVNGTSVTVGWSSNLDADSFLIRYQRNCTGSFTYLYVPGNLRQYSLTGLLGCTNYCFRMKAFCGSTSTAYNTTSVSFTTGQGPACVAANGITATNVSGCTFLISWSNCTSADSFRIRYRLGSGPWQFSGFTTGFSNQLNLSPGTYTYRIQTYCNGNLAATTANQTLAIPSCRIGIFSEIEELKITPNPVSGNRIIVSGIREETSYNFTITDITGRILCSGVVDNSGEIILPENSVPGMYILKLKLSNEYKVCDFFIL
jgi:hypothetical protein